ncbi:MAG: hypothetical protein ACHQ2Y_05375 [Candidatus Lutacidiplasmatales archaeon]
MGQSSFDLAAMPPNCFRGIAAATFLIASTLSFVSFAAASHATPVQSTTGAWKFMVTPLTNVSTNSSCLHSAVTVSPHFAASTQAGHARAWSALNSSAIKSCQGQWLSSYAQAFVVLSTPINLTASTHNVTVNWTTTYAGTVSTKKLGTCPRADNAACTTIANFLVYDSAYVWDNTSQTAYCVLSSNSPSYIWDGSVCGPMAYGLGWKCDFSYVLGYWCPSWGPNERLNGTFTGRSEIQPSSYCFPTSAPGSFSNCYWSPGSTFNASHQYTLKLTIGAVAVVASFGWKATAFASVDLAGKDGSTMTAVAVH